MTRRRLTRLFWLGAAAILVAAALVAVAAVLRGDFSETEGRILGTLAAVLYTSGALLTGLANVVRGRRVVGGLLVGMAPVCLALLAPAIWGVFDESDEGNTWRWGWTAVLVVLAGLMLGTALLLARSAVAARLAYATGALAALAAALGIAAVWSEPSGDGWPKALAAFSILAVLGYVLVPIVDRFGRPPAAASERVLAALDGVELVATPAGTVDPRLAAGERLLLRRRPA